ncbi:hypothetical protein [Streptomyces sp. NPDC047869]|uniref:hypothetical protein n=1 Tax=Streptomyces sp. NPDC047869 TaxID=3154709 RepID=UPI003453E763
MTRTPDVAVARVVALAEQATLHATLEHVDQALAANRRESDAPDRIEAAAPRQGAFGRGCGADWRALIPGWLVVPRLWLYGRHAMGSTVPTA